MNMLYQLPYADGRKDTPQWPTTETIKSLEVRNVVVVEECLYLHVLHLVEMSNILLIKSQSYSPSVFVLKPGQHVLINKGRLHAFRKMTFDELPITDCRAAQRSELVAMLKEEKKMDHAPLCISIAYDW